MAGGKETPRQKMIGMMYLVLTALLALQVSSAIIQKFSFINKSLEDSASQIDNNNEDLYQRMKITVADKKNDPQDVKYLSYATDIRSQSQRMIKRIREIKTELIRLSGGLEEDGTLVGAKDEEPVAQYMIGATDSKKGKGYALKSELNSYVEYLNDMMDKAGIEKNLSLLALDGSKDPLFREDPEQNYKDFAHLNFENTPTAAALAVLSEKENKILNYEATVLDFLSEKVGTNKLLVDKIRPVVMPNANTLVAGMEYEADIFMAAYNSNLKPKIKHNDQTVEVSEEGIGKVKFRTSGGNYNEEGKVAKTWKGSITFPMKGKDTTFTLEQNYTVIKPAIQVSSSALQALYYQCGNKLNVQVPALGTAYNPTITAQGGELIRGGKAGQVTVVPSSSKVILAVKNNGVFIDDLEFPVKKVPDAKPILLDRNNRPFDKRRGNPMPRTIKVKVQAEENFAEQNPDDKTYAAARWTATLVRNNRAVKKLPCRGNECDVSEFNNYKGDNYRILVELEDVKRRNFQGNWLDATVSETIFNIPVN